MVSYLPTNYLVTPCIISHCIFKLFSYTLYGQLLTDYLVTPCIVSHFIFRLFSYTLYGQLLTNYLVTPCIVSHCIFRLFSYTLYSQPLYRQTIRPLPAQPATARPISQHFTLTSTFCICLFHADRHTFEPCSAPNGWLPPNVVDCLQPTVCYQPFRLNRLIPNKRIHITVTTRVGILIVATIYLQLIQNRYMFRSFTVLQCSHQHCLQPVASDVEVVGYL